MNPSDPQGDVLRDRSDTAFRELQAEHERLRYLFVLSLASFVVLSLALCGFVFKQWRVVKFQVREQEAVVQNMWRDYSKTSQPMIQKFVLTLQGFAAQNRDFEPVLEKYRRPLGDYFSPTSAAPAPAMTPSSTPKPPPK